MLPVLTELASSRKTTALTPKAWFSTDQCPRLSLNGRSASASEGKRLVIP